MTHTHGVAVPCGQTAGIAQAAGTHTPLGVP